MAMENLLCICAYVYGGEYQNYIPMYVYSIIKNHPQYHVRIYLDSYLKENVRQLLNDMDQSKFDIIENFYNPYFERSMEKRALRWLITDEVLDKYKYVYIGDVDIYLVDEPDFLETHIRDMKKTKNIYSNAVRLTICDFIKRGAKKEDYDHLFKLTGLHFYETKPYRENVNKEKGKLIWEMEHIDEIPVYKKLFLKRFVLTDDERTLWYLIYKSHIKRPCVSLEKYGNGKKCCRPTHGVHFGTGRELRAYERMVVKRIQLGGVCRYQRRHKTIFAFCKGL